MLHNGFPELDSLGHLTAPSSRAIQLLGHNEIRHFSALQWARGTGALLFPLKPSGESLGAETIFTRQKWEKAEGRRDRQEGQRQQRAEKRVCIQGSDKEVVGEWMGGRDTGEWTCGSWSCRGGNVEGGHGGHRYKWTPYRRGARTQASEE